MTQPDQNSDIATTPDAADPFDLADFYDVYADPDYLSWDSPEDAIQEYADCNGLDGEDTGAPGPITVYAWAKYTVGADYWETLGEELAERVASDFCEDHGNPDDGDDVPPEVTALFVTAAKAAAAYFEVWQCKTVGSRKYSGAEVLAIVGEVDHG